MGNLWEDFSLMDMGLRNLNPMGLYPLPFLVVGFEPSPGTVYIRMYI
jgi:hypothetical protein